MVKNIPTIERSTKVRFGKNALDDQAENTIVFNASNASLNANTAYTIYISPVRLREDYDDPAIVLLMYNKDTKEVTESGEAATDIIETTLQGAALRGNVINVSTVYFDNVSHNSLVSDGNVGIVNTNPLHTFSVGSNLYVDDTGSNVLVVNGGVSINGNLDVKGGITAITSNNLIIEDAIIELGKNNTSGDTTLDLGLIMGRPDSNVTVGFKEETDEIILAFTESSAYSNAIVPLTSEDINVHVYGRLYTESNVGVLNTNPMHTLDVGSNLYVDEFGSNILVVTGNTSVSGDLTVDTDTLFVDSSENKVGIKTVTPSAELHVVGNAYVSSNLTVDTDTLHVDVVNDSIGVGTVNPSANLHVVGNVYVSSNLTVDTNTLHVDAENKSIGVGTMNPTSNLHVVGNAYVTSNITTDGTLKLDDPTTALITDLTANVEVKLNQLANVVIGEKALTNEDILVYDGSNWTNQLQNHTFLYAKAEETIDKGDAVYATGTIGNNTFSIRKAQANLSATMPALGLAYQDFALNDQGLIVTFGRADGINTDNFQTGETVYVSNVTAGALSNVKPYGSGDLIQNIGLVVKGHPSTGIVSVTGVGRSNDIPNAPIVADEGDINYVYVNDNNNDLKKILPTNLLTQLQTLQQVTDTGNTTSNTIQFTDVTTGLVTVANVEVGSNISVAGLIDAVNKHVPMVGTDGFLEKSPIYFTPGGTYVVSAAEAEFLGNLTLSGNTTILNSESVTISDRIFGVAANNSASGLDSGFMIEHQEGNPLEYANVALIYHADEHRFSFSYTQNTFTDDHILHYEDETHRMLIDLIGNVEVQHNLVVNETVDVTGTTSLANDLTVGAASNLFVDVSTSRVGINEASPSTSLDVGGDVNIQSVVSATSKTSGALVVAGGVGVGGDVYASNAVLSGDFTVDTDTLIVNSTTDRVNIKALDVAGDAIVADDFTVDTNTLHVDSVTDRVGVGTLGPDAKLHVVGNAYVSSDVTVDGTTFHVDAGTHSIGVGTVTPEANLHVAGNAYILNEITMNSTVDVQDATEAFSTTTGAVTIAGGLGVVGNVHAAQYHGDGSKLRGLVTTLEDVADNGNTMSNTIQFTNTTTSFVTEGNVGISNTAPEHDLSIGSNVYIEDVGSNVIHATGNIYATRFIGDGSFLENIASSLQQITDNGSETTNTVEFQNTGTSLITFGNVGVANTTPGHDLSVGSNLFVEDVGSNVVHVTGNIYATRFIGDGSFLENIASNLHEITTNGNVTTNTVQFDGSTAFVTTGKVGISNTNPTANLHVTGNAHVSGELEVLRLIDAGQFSRTRIGSGSGGGGTPNSDYNQIAIGKNSG